MAPNLGFGSLWRWLTDKQTDGDPIGLPRRRRSRRGYFPGRGGRRHWLEELEDRTVPTGAIAGAIDVPGETDVYTFHLDADAQLYFDSVTNNASLTWTLAGPAGTLVNARAFSLSDANDLVGNPVLNLAGGDYTLTVDAVADVTGAYEFRLHDLADAIPMTPSVAVSGDLSPANETDLYRFNAAAGESFYFNVQARSGASNARWRLISPFNEIVFERAFNSDLVNSDAGPFTVAQPGTYTLLLEGRVSDTGGANSGTYAFTVHPVTPAAATPLTVGDVAAGSIGSPGAVNHFTFNLATDARLYFDSQTANAALTWTLTGPPGTVVNARSFNASDSFDFIPSPVLDLPAGSYTLTVDGNADATGAYQFRLRDLAAATAVTPGTSFAGDLNPANETDLFRFDAAAGDRAFFDVVAASDTGNAIWRLISPFGVQVFRQNLIDVAEVTLPSTGTYTLLVEGWHSNTGLDTYTLNAVIQSEPAPVALALNSAVTGSLDVAGERDRYTFTLAASGLGYFDALTNNSALNWTLTGPAGTLVSARSFTATDSFDFTSNPALSLAPGDYTLTVAVQQSATAAYSFRLSNLLDAGAATAITPGTPFSGELTLPNETDLYRFSAAAGDQFLFDVTAASDTSSNIVWQLIGPHGSVLFRRVGLTDVATLTLPGAGDYTLLIEGWIGNTGTDTYTIDVAPQGNIPPGFTGTALTLGSTVSDTIAVNGEQDVYTFTLAAPTRVYFDSLSTTNMLWTLAGPPDVVVSARNFNNSDSFDFSGNPAIELPAGDYGLTVSGAFGATGAYSFRLSDLAAATTITPGTSFGGDFMPATETDLYRFDATAGERFFFDVVTAADTGNIIWQLVSPLGIVLARTGNFVDIDALTLPTSGAYTLLVEAWRLNTDADAYTLNVVSVADDVVPLTLGNAINSMIDTPGERDIYTFTLAGAARLYFDSFNNSTFTWTLTGPAGTLVDARQFGSSDSFDFTGNPVLSAAAGTYTLTVDGTGDGAGPYGFRLSDLATVTALTPATPQAGDFTPATETDLYRFDANAGDRVYFDVVTTNDSGNTIWQLVSPFNVVLFRTNSFTDVATLTLPSTGTYTLLVEAWDQNAGADAYSINVVPQVETAPVPLVLNDAVNGIIDFAGERDRYTFTLGAAALLYFDSLTNSANFNWTLTGPPGTVVNALAFSATDSFDFTGNPALNLPAGDYTLTIGGSQSATGVYSFRLSDLGTVTELTVGTPQASTLTPPNETDVYRFDASAGDRIYFDIVAASDTGSSIWQVINPFGLVVFRASGLVDVPTLTLPGAGSYSVLVEGWTSNAGADTYTLNIVKQIETPPSPLTLGSMVSGTLDAAGERDRHTFSVATPTLVCFDAQTNNAGLNWTLSGPAGTLVDSRLFTATDSFDFATNPAIKLVPGDYTVTIAGLQSTTGPYSFRLSDLGAAATITPGAEFSGELTVPSETDLYRFSANAGDRFSFDVVAASDTGSTIWQLVSSFGTVIFRSGFGDTATLTLPSTGDYTLLVEGWLANSGIDTYTLNVVPQGNVPPPSPSGTALTLGNTVSDSIAAAGEVDSYVFTLAADARLYFDSFTNSAQMFWSLTGPAGVVVNSRAFNASDSVDIANPAIDLVAGTYGLTVAGGAGVTGVYSFRLSDFTAATPITPGTPVSEAIDPANETDLYRFDAAAGSSFYFDVTARTGANATRWRLVNPFGAVVFERAFSNDLANSDAGPLTLAAAGSYTLLIEPVVLETSTGAYTFNVHPLAPTPRTVLTIGDAHIVNAGADVAINESGTVNLAPATYSDAGTTILLTTARVDWGDGTPVQSATVDQVLRTVAGSHTYADNGVYTVTVTVFNDDWGDRSDTFTVTVNNVDPTLAVVGNQTVNEGSSLNLPDIGTFTDPGFNNPLNPPPGETDETFTFEILWGDGLTSAGTATIDQLGAAGTPSAGSLGGSHVYADNGVYTVTVRVFDDDDGMDQETFQVTVNNVAPTLAVVANQAVNEGQTLSLVNVGSFTDPGFDNPLNPLPGETTETFTFEINWGDGTAASTGSATIDTPGAIGSATAGSFDGSHVYADNGVYTVTVRAFDDDGGMDEETLQITVSNVAPVLNVVANQNANEGQSLNITDLATFTDPGFNNPLNPAPGETEETFTFEINWGDGQPLDTGAATVDTPGSPGVLTAGSFNGSHIYAEHGVYVVTVRVFDDDGGMDEETFQVTVNDTPTVTAPIADLTVDEDAAAVLDHAVLDAVFADTDNLDSELTYSIAAVTPGGIVTVTIQPDDTLDLSFAANASGIVDITVRATDPSGLFVEDTFRATVNTVNDDPTVTAPIADTTVLQGAAPVLDHADLNAVFADVDNADAELTYTVAGNTGAGIVTATIGADDTLDLSFAAAQNGIADITIRATDPQGGFVEDTFRVTVLPRTATTTTITQSSPSPSAFGQAVTFTVTVVPSEVGGELPTGTLTFMDGVTVLGTSTALADVGGAATATFTTSELATGARTITAHYAGDALFAPSDSAGFAHTVNPAATTTAITLSGPSPSIVGQVVTFTITVTPGANGLLPTGTLTLMDGATTLGVSTPLTDVGGVATATFTTTAGQLAVGARTITAVYAGDANFAGGTSAGFTHTVNPLTAVPDVYNAKKNKKLKVSAARGVLVNDGQTGVQAKLVRKPKKGKLALKANGSFTYTPATNAVGKVTFTYRLSSAFGISAPVTVTIRVK